MNNDYPVTPMNINNFTNEEIMKYHEILGKMQQEHKGNDLIYVAVVGMREEGRDYIYGAYLYESDDSTGSYWETWSKDINYYYYLFEHERERRNLPYYYIYQKR